MLKRHYSLNYYVRCGLKVSVWIIQWNLYSEECVTHVAVRSGISPLTNKRVKPRKDSAVCHHLLNCNYWLTFEDFSVLCHDDSNLLQLKEMVIMRRDRSSMNWNVRFTPLCLFEWVLVTLFAALCWHLWLVFYLFCAIY